jgi:hydrogenase maturation protein HypF
MLEHGLRGPVLAVVWDGAGLGDDGTIWGGEFLRVERTSRGVSWRRVAHLRAFRLAGGDAAAREPERALAGVLAECEGLREAVDARMLRLLEIPAAAPWCTSAGRLFDAAAALLGLGWRQTFEGQAAMALEACATVGAAIGLPLEQGVLDWRPLFGRMAAGLEAGTPAGVLAAEFHASLSHGIAKVAGEVGEHEVVLTGGCFQNRRITEQTVALLRDGGFAPFIARAIPPNDGGISAGQLVAAVEGLRERDA